MPDELKITSAKWKRWRGNVSNDNSCVWVMAPMVVFLSFLRMIILISFQFYKLENQLKAPKRKSQYLKSQRISWGYFKVSRCAHSFMRDFTWDKIANSYCDLWGICVYSESCWGGWKDSGIIAWESRPSHPQLPVFPPRAARTDFCPKCGLSRVTASHRLLWWW